MKTCFFRSSPRRGDRMRATTSEALPAGNGTTRVTGLVGQAWTELVVCAAAGNDASPNSTATSKTMLGTSPPWSDFGHVVVASYYPASIVSKLIYRQLIQTQVENT